MGDEEDLVGRLAGFDQHVAGFELLLDELLRQRGEHFGVVQPAQQRQLAELLGDDLHVGTDIGERHPPVADGIAAPLVDPVGATGGLHPGQHLQQPPRGDLLHLGHGLGRSRQVPRSLSAQTLPHLPVFGTDSRIHQFSHSAHHPSIAVPREKQVL